MSAEPWLPGTRRTTVTVGTFDGIHRGHQAVLEEIVGRAHAADRASVLVTFEPHPLVVVAPDRAPCLLTTAAEKGRLWPLFGLDYVHVLRFDEALRATSPEDFVRDILVERLRVGELVIGYDHGFGRDRRGDVDTLRQLGDRYAFTVDVVGPVTDGDEAVSSSALRAAIREGDLTRAELGLGRPYAALGVVRPGQGRGRRIGFPTANVGLDDRKCLPPEAVYAVRVDLDGVVHGGMANLGPRPTFDDPAAGLEVHLLGWRGGSLEGRTLEIEFAARLRAIRRFAGPAELVEQLGRDRDAARAALGPGRDRQGVA